MRWHRFPVEAIMHELAEIPCGSHYAQDSRNAMCMIGLCPDPLSLRGGDLSIATFTDLQKKLTRLILAQLNPRLCTGGGRDPHTRDLHTPQLTKKN